MTLSGPRRLNAQRVHTLGERSGPPSPLRVEIELVVVSGAKGRYLRQKQDDAIRSMFQWLQRPGLGGLVRTCHSRYGSALPRAGSGADLAEASNRVVDANRPHLRKRRSRTG